MVEKKDVRCFFGGHHDFEIEWDKTFEGSIATPTFRGMILMKYSSVPEFIYSLASPITDFSFISEEHRKEIRDEKDISYYHGHHFDLAMCVEGIVELGKSFWEGEYESKVFEPEFLKMRREQFELTPLIQTLEENNIDYKSLEYIGGTTQTAEYKSRVHVLLSKEKETYIAQNRWMNSMNLLKLNEQKRNEVILDIISLYGTNVSAALRDLIYPEKALKLD
ncbi:MAG: hypothetical protein KJ767_00820 [Nanoarchaeota archaeon]|nr:hypothetical protein [Nanoarchaeota archaeon]